MGNPVDIQELVTRAAAGDAEAFGKLYDTFMEAIYRFIYFRVGSVPDAEDVTEQVFVSAFTNIKQYQERGLPFQAWLFRIARNKMIDYYRSRRAHIPLDDVAEMVRDDAESPEEIVDRALTREAVMKSLALLPHQYQEILILKFIEDKGNEEISQLLDKPIAHIRVLQNRAIGKLKKVINHG